MITEKALIMEDRIDYADWILKEPRAKKLHNELKNLLDSEETKENINNLEEFVHEFEMEIHSFDVRALDASQPKETQDG